MARRYEFYVRVARTISHANVLCSFYYINILMTPFLMIFRRFPTAFRRFSKIVPKARRTFPNIFREFPENSGNFRRCPKIAEDFRGGPEDLSMIHQRIYVQFKRQTWYHRNHRYLHM